MELAIGQLGLTDDDSKRLRQVMSIAVTKRVFESRWVVGRPESANFLVVTPDSLEQAKALLHEQSSADKQIAVLVGESDTAPQGFKTLSWPIRYEQLIPMLHEIESSQRAYEDTVRIPLNKAKEPAGEKNIPLFRLAMLVNENEERGADQRAWKISGFAESSIYVVPGDSFFYYKGSIASLRKITDQASFKFTTLPVAEIDAAASKKPLPMLQWLVGIRSGRLGLFPWLQDISFLKLRRYPPFASLHHTPSHRRIAALLTRPCKNIDQLASLSQLDEETIAGFVNAASLCGYLVTKGKHSKIASFAKRPEAPKRALLTKFRNALGIGAANV